MPDPSPPAVRNPYPGLRPFRTDEEHLFFGREQQVDHMISRLAAHRFLAVVGGSGSGKSSLVNCGLRPALHRGYMAGAGANWRMAQFRPGSDPISALSRALAAPGVLFDQPLSGPLSGEDLVDSTLRLGSLGLVQMVEQADLPPGTQLLVVADQFEEMFRFSAAQCEGGVASSNVDEVAFVKLLLEAAAQTEVPIHVVLTMRSDFLGDCAQFDGLPEAINQGQYLVPRLTREQIRAAIIGPAQVQGETIDPVLVTRLLNDVGDNPDQLSILQHALNRTWAHWENEGHGKGKLGLPDYEAIGGMADALNRHAEKAFRELPDEASQRLCEKVFKALTDTGTDARGIRRMTRLDRLCEITNATLAQLQPVFDVFRKPSRSFLMPPQSEPLSPHSDIDISHESLMRVWKRLRKWADEEAQSAVVFCALRDKAAQYSARQASLWREPELGDALRWRARNEPTPAWAAQYGGGFNAAMDFLDDSLAHDSAEEAARRGRRRVRTTLIVGALVTLLPAAIIWLATEVNHRIKLAASATALQNDLDSIDQVRASYAARKANPDPEIPDDCKTMSWSPHLYQDPPRSNPFAALTELCNEKVPPPELDQFFDFATHVQRGELLAASELVEKMPGSQAVPARQLLELVAEMQSPAIRVERECLAEMAGKKPGTIIGARCPKAAKFRHPAHRSMAAKLAAAELNADAKTEALPRMTAGEKRLLEVYGAARRDTAHSQTSPAARSAQVDDTEEPTVRPSIEISTEWIYERMARSAREPEPLEKLRAGIEPFAGSFFVLLAWPAWFLWRRRQVRNGDEIAHTPSDFRRALALLFDVGIAAAFAVAVGSTVQSTLAVSGLGDWDQDGSVTGAATLITLVAYLLLADAICFHYCRSFGKIVFDLRPLNHFGPNPGRISLLASARRNIPKLFALLAVGLMLMPFAVFDLKPAWMASVLPILTYLAGLWLVILLRSKLARRRAARYAIDSLEAARRRLRRVKIMLFLSVLLTILMIVGGLMNGDFLSSLLTFGLWAAGAMPFLIPLLRGEPLVPTRVIDADSKLSQHVDAPPRYTVTRPAEPLALTA